MKKINLTSSDTNGNIVHKFSKVQIPLDLTTDPFNKRGQIGIVSHINLRGDIDVKFEDNSYGTYSEGCVILVN